MKIGRIEDVSADGSARVMYDCASDWPDPAPLGDELIPVPAFDVELLPPSFQPLVQDISERMQAPADYAAAAAVVTLAGCVNRRATVIPKQADTSWQVVLNLWGAIVAPPGMMKSPILRAVTLPLARIEEKWRAEYESACGDFTLEKERAELRWQAWREGYKRAVKKGKAEPVQPDTTLRPPTQQRLVVCDATFEKLHEILAQNPAGVFVLRDELSGWLSELERLGREGERGFFLQAWNGDVGFTVDRIMRGSIHVPAVCVSLLGAIQPARLRSYLAEAIENGPGDDGLFERFQIVVWPDLPRSWNLVDRPPCESAFRSVEQIFEKLANLSEDNPVRMRFTPDAQVLFFAWLTELERKIRGESGLAPALISHLSKYRSLMPTLSGLFELADRAAANDTLQGEIAISLTHAKQAAAFCDFLEAHAKRVYGCVVSSETRAARELARHIQAGDLPSPFSTRMTYLKGWRDGAASIRLSAFGVRSNFFATLHGFAGPNRRRSQVEDGPLRLGLSIRRSGGAMRSKWLDWKPSVEIIDETHEAEPSKPTKPGFEGFVGSFPEASSITRCSRTADGRCKVSSVRPEQKFGQSHARLFPFLGRKVRTPNGPGTLLQVFADRVTVLLDSELSKCSFFRPGEIEPVSRVCEP